MICIFAEQPRPLRPAGKPRAWGPWTSDHRRCSWSNSITIRSESDAFRLGEGLNQVGPHSGSNVEGSLCGGWTALVLPHPRRGCNPGRIPESITDVGD